MSRDRQWQESVSRDASSAPSVASSHNGRCARIRAAYAIARCNTSKSVRVGAAEACKQSRIENVRSHPVVVDVVTTSGDATGSPPDHEKVRLFRDALGNFDPLALASGMTPDNVASYIEDGADAFLVATGIESSFGHFDRQKMHDFVKRVRDAPRNGRSLAIHDRQQ